MHKPAASPGCTEAFGQHFAKRKSEENAIIRESLKLCFLMKNSRELQMSFFFFLKTIYPQYDFDASTT